MEEKIDVKEAHILDIDKFLEIEKVSFKDPWSRSMFLSELEDRNRRIYYKALINEEVAGFIGLWFIVDECHIVNIAVHPDFRNKGVAKSLVQRAVMEGGIRGVNSFTLEVRAGNEEAIKLYEGLGFMKAGYRKNYYEKEREDGIIMWLVTGEEKNNG